MLFDVIIRKSARTIAVSTVQRQEHEPLTQFTSRAIQALHAGHQRHVGQLDGTPDTPDIERIGDHLRCFIHDVYNSGTPSAECTVTVSPTHQAGVYQGDIQVFLDDTESPMPIMVARIYARPPVLGDALHAERKLETA